MRPSFCPRLINPPFDDPGLYIPFPYQNRSILMDLGDLAPLSARDLLKVSHVFVTHTHMDHFVGFDRLLRLFIARGKTLYLFGPEGFLGNVEGKLAGYTWNLVESYETSLVLEVTEVVGARMNTQRYACNEKFRPSHEPVSHSFGGNLLEEPELTVKASSFDHGIPCLGFVLEERFHVNIRKERLDSLGLKPGPWLQEFKRALYAGTGNNIEAETVSGEIRIFGVSFLREEIAVISAGQKIAYITDVEFNPKTAEKIVAFVENADHLFIEAAFLESDRVIAAQKSHLTARQAGWIAGKARVKKLTPFHFSPRYTGNANQLEEETEHAYRQALPCSMTL